MSNVAISQSVSQEESKMNTRNIKPLRLLLILTMLVGSMGLATTALADHGHGMYGGGMYGGKGMSGMCWKETLTDEQRTKLAKLKLDYMKAKAPIKAKMKTVKVDLAMLVTTDKPDMNAINKKIDELTKLKNDKMKEKYKYIAAKRKVLTAEQQVLFDTRVIKKAMYGKGKTKRHSKH
jgi:Spy/CpxP family protein refolding chaperone